MQNIAIIGFFTFYTVRNVNINSDAFDNKLLNNGNINKSN